ncbi:MAG: flagellin [Oleispira sp.]
MPQIINTNIASLNAQRNLDKSQSSNQQALQRLSSGLRINSAKDDAAGLAISTRFTSQIKGLNVAVRNAGDGIALAQTAEGALGSMNDSLQRIRELAVQSSNATNSDVDRDALQAEVDQLVAEISRTADETDFNGRNLLDGSFSASFQVGANAGQTIDVSIGELTADKLGSSSQSGLSAIGTDNALENGDLVINGVAISASKAEDDTSSTSGNSASAISKVEAINRFSDETGVSAQISENTASGSEMSGLAGTGTISINGVDISISTTTDTAQTRASITEAINAVANQTGVTAVNSDSAAGGVDLVAADGRNIQLSFDTADLSADFGASDSAKAASFASATGLPAGAVDVDGVASGTVYSNTYEGGYTLIADGDQKTIDISGGNGTGRGDLSNAGLTEGSYDRAVAATVSEVKADATVATTNAGGSISSDSVSSISRTDVGGTLIEGATGNSQQTTTTALTSVAVNSGSFAVSGTDSSGNAVAATFAVGTTTSDVSTIASQLQIAATTAGINVNVYEQIDLTIDTASLAVGEALILGGVTVTISGSSQQVMSENLMNDLNAGGFIADVGATGFVHAELDAAGTGLSLTIRNETTSGVSIASSTAGSIGFDVSGGTVASASTGHVLSGKIGFESTDNQEVTVVTTDTTGDLTGTTATLSDASSANQALASSSETDISITIGGVDASPAAPLAGGSTVAQLASAVDGVDGVEAYEEISLTLNASSLESGEQLRISAGGNDIDISATPDNAGNMSLAALVDDINATDFSGASLNVTASLNTGGTAIELSIKNFSGSTVSIESENADGAGVTIDTTGADIFAGEQARGLAGELKFFSTDGQDVNVTLSDPTTGGELFAGKSSSADYTGVNGLQDGDILINNVTIGGAEVGADTASATVSSDGSKILSSEKGLSAIAVAAAINKVSAETEVSATVNETKVVGGDGDGAVPASFEQGDQAGLFINGVNIGSVTLQNEGATTNVDTDRARADTLNLINQNSGKTGVTAEDNGVSLTLTAADGRNISIAIDDRAGSDDSIGALLGLDAAQDGIGESTFGSSTAIAGSATTAEASTYETTYSTVKLESAKEFTIEGGENGNDELEALGLAAGTYGGGEDGQFLNDIDITTVEGATAALTAIDNAIGQVASQRADLGAVQNRLESTVSNLQVTSENLNAANSRIQDADFAAETAELQRTNVLQQAGISVLAQANASGQQVLSLLG